MIFEVPKNIYYLREKAGAAGKPKQKEAPAASVFCKQGAHEDLCV